MLMTLMGLSEAGLAPSPLEINEMTPCAMPRGQHPVSSTIAKNAAKRCSISSGKAFNSAILHPSGPGELSFILFSVNLSLSASIVVGAISDLAGIASPNFLTKSSHDGSSLTLYILKMGNQISSTSSAISLALAVWVPSGRCSITGRASAAPLHQP